MYKPKGDRTEQHWSHDYVEGSRYGEQKPVYILINNDSFSAAEDFSYTLKNLGRATLVGESSGGGANSGDFVSLTPNYSIFLPTGSGISPITKTNWEGVGVVPHIAVESKKSLSIAQITILEKLKKDEANSARIKRIDSRIKSLKESH